MDGTCDNILTDIIGFDLLNLNRLDQRLKGQYLSQKFQIHFIALLYVENFRYGYLLFSFLCVYIVNIVVPSGRTFWSPCIYNPECVGYP